VDLSTASLFANLVVSTIGFGIFLYGKKERRPPQLITGVLLMVFPYFVGSASWMLAIAAAMIAAMWFAVRRGL
jgi:hypothetical protein